MKCPECKDRDWPRNVKFCGTCGKRLVDNNASPKAPEVHAAIEQLRSLLPEIGLGDFEEPAPGIFVAKKGSTHVQVRAVPVGLGLVAIRSTSPVTTGTPITPALMEFLLSENAKFVFGAFGIGQRKEIVFNHSIMASSVDVVELGTSVSTVVNMADRYDDQIVERWGGKTARQVSVDASIAPALMELLSRRRAERTQNARRPGAMSAPPTRRRSPHTSPLAADAIKVRSIPEEYAYLAKLRCNCGGRYDGETQALLEVHGVMYDRLDVRCVKCGDGRSLLFDISSFFGKRM